MICDSEGPGERGRYRLEGPGIETRWGARLPAPVQTGSGAHPASYKMGTGSFPGVKQSGRGVDHAPPTSVDIKERVGLYIYSPLGFRITHKIIKVDLIEHISLFILYFLNIYQPYRTSTCCSVRPKHVVELIMNKLIV
jgi:hypothetical protein